MRRLLAGLILGISLIVASMTWGGFGALRTVLDPDRSETVADTLLEDEAVQGQLQANLVTAFRSTIPDGVPVTDAQLEAAAEIALQNPVIETLIRDALVQTHAAFLGEGEAPETLDLGGAADTLRQGLVTINPEFDSQIPPTPALTLDLPTERIPNLGWLRDGLSTLVPIGALIAIGGALLALFTTTNRPAILRRAGVWCIGAAAVWLILSIGIPWLAERFAGDQAVIASSFVEALFGKMRTPSIVLAVIGGGLIGLSFLWPMLTPDLGRGRRRDPEPQPQRSPGASQTVSNLRQMQAQQAAQQAAAQQAAAHQTQVQRPVQPVAPPTQARPPQRPPAQATQPPPRSQPQTSAPYPDQRATQQPASPYPDARPTQQPPRPASPYPDAPQPEAPAEPAPQWVEGVGYVDPDAAAPKWVAGVGYVDENGNPVEG